MTIGDTHAVDARPGVDADAGTFRVKRCSGGQLDQVYTHRVSCAMDTTSG